MKVGDKVRVLSVVNAGVDDKYVGQIGTVVGRDTDADVLFDDGDAWFFELDDIELVEQQVFIVIDEEDNLTAEWLSLEDAERDARLSAEQLGECFTVYQRIVQFGVKTEVVETRG